MEAKGQAVEMAMWVKERTNLLQRLVLVLGRHDAAKKNPRDKVPKQNKNAMCSRLQPPCRSASSLDDGPASSVNAQKMQTTTGKKEILLWVSSEPDVV